jgi:hypothetical protein
MSLRRTRRGVNARGNLFRDSIEHPRNTHKPFESRGRNRSHCDKASKNNYRKGFNPPMSRIILFLQERDDGASGFGTLFDGRIGG